MLYPSLQWTYCTDDECPSPQCDPSSADKWSRSVGYGPLKSKSDRDFERGAKLARRSSGRLPMRAP